MRSCRKRGRGKLEKNREWGRGEREGGGGKRKGRERGRDIERRGRGEIMREEIYNVERRRDIVTPNHYDYYLSSYEFQSCS